MKKEQKNIFEIFKNKKTNSFLKILIIILILYFIFKGIAVLVILMALSIGFSYIINTLKIRSIGFELVTFIAVISGLKYGSKIAFIITFILITYHLVAGGFIGTYVFWVIPAYCLAAIFSGFYPQADITFLGIIATIGINLNNIFFTAITSFDYLPKYLIYAITNIIFNILIFMLFRKIFLLIM
ncbi:MAG: hypothetical protein QW757_02675 [Candidatus Woesearchaeota archaeon]